MLGLYYAELNRVQDICRRHGLPTHGNLEELWDRLIEHQKQQNKENKDGQA